MPIATCFVEGKTVRYSGLNVLIQNWAKDINVGTQDVSISVVPNCIHAGQNFKLLTILYLPSIWSEENITKIQKTLLMNLCEYFDFRPQEIFIITTIVNSGNVVENGQIINW